MCVGAQVLEKDEEMMATKMSVAERVAEMAATKDKQIDEMATSARVKGEELSAASAAISLLNQKVASLPAGCRVQGAGCRVQGAGCRVQGPADRRDDAVDGGQGRGALRRLRRYQPPQPEGCEPQRPCSRFCWRWNHFAPRSILRLRALHAPPAVLPTPGCG